MIGADNNKEFYYRNKKILKYCLCCGLIINRAEAIRESLKSFKLGNIKKNFTLCTDGPAIVSQKFKEVVDKYNLNGFVLEELPQSKNFYLLDSSSIVEYDYDFNPKIYLKNKCNCCSQWTEVTKINPIKILDRDEEKLIVDTLYKTDLEYGEKVLRTPILLVTDKIPFIFKKEGINDVIFSICGRDWIPGDFRKNIYK